MINKHTTSLHGDIGWNTDGAKGECKDSGMFIYHYNPDGTNTLTAYKGNGSWSNAKFTPTMYGAQRVEFSALTVDGYWTTRGLDFTVKATVSDVEELISAIDITDYRSVVLAKAAYDTLTEEEVASVSNADVLTQAEGLAVAVKNFKDSFVMHSGAQLRLKAPAGIRWTTNFSVSAYEALESLVDGEIVTGTLVSTVELVGEGNLTLNANYTVQNIVRTVWGAPNDDLGNFNAALVEIKENNYEKVYTAVGYLTFEFNGETIEIYATQNDNNRSVCDMANELLEKGGFDDKYLDILNKFAGKNA